MMDEQQILSVVRAEIDAAQASRGSRLSELWREALHRYHGRPTGTELPGQSAAVSMDINDAITWIMPELIRVFLDERVCSVSGTDAETSQFEDEISQALNHLFYDANPGDALTFLYDFVRDLLLQMNGVGKVYWDESTKIDRIHLINPSDDQLTMLLNEEGVQLSPTDAEGNPLEGTQVDEAGNEHVHLERRRKVRKLRCAAMAPENFLITSTARSLDTAEARFVSHYCPMLASDIVVTYGADPDFVATLPDADWITTNQTHGTDVNNARDRLGLRSSGIGSLRQNGDDSTAYKEVYESYILMDVDGDGIAERWKVVTSGNHLLEKQLWEGDPPFFSSSPFPEPHQFWGMSIYDKLREVQSAKTALMRQLEDNNALVNNPQREVDVTKVHLSDLKTRRPGSYIRSKQIGSVANLPVQPFGQETYAALDYHDRLIQRRTGANPGSSAEILPVGGNTAHGAERLMSAQEEVQWLISQIIAETGIRRLFCLLYDALRADGSPIDVKIGDEWTQLDPSRWPEDVTIRVKGAAGLGQRSRHAAALQMLIQYQGAMLDRGLGGVMVTEQGVYAAIEDWQKSAGLNPSRGYFQDPESQQAQQAQAGKMQTQMQQMQQQQQREQLATEIAVRKQRLDEMKAQASVANDQAKVAVEYDKVIAKEERELTELELKYGSDVPGSLV